MPPSLICFDDWVPSFLDEFVFAALAVSAALLTLYWIIRLAVQHALREHRRSS